MWPHKSGNEIIYVTEPIDCYLQKFVKESDLDKSGDVGLVEFVEYIREHEKSLKLQFSQMDKNKDGKTRENLERPR